MTIVPYQNLLLQQGLRDTQPRRLVFASLVRHRKPVSPYDIQKSIAAKGGTVNTVTVYRILSLFEEHHLVHREAETGKYFLCSMPQKPGHHGHLKCNSCGRIDEFQSEDLCRIEDAIAQKFKFKPSAHLSEIAGTCSSCLAR